MSDLTGKFDRASSNETPDKFGRSQISQMPDQKYRSNASLRSNPNAWPKLPNKFNWLEINIFLFQMSNKTQMSNSIFIIWSKVSLKLLVFSEAYWPGA